MAVHSTYEVRWQNFKGFKDTGWKKIKPITILLGNNNSGKTSFIAPLLLMNQTLLSRDPYSPLIIKGPVYDGGNINELTYDYDLANDIHFGFKYHVHEPKGKLKKVGTYPPGAFEVTIGTTNKESKEIVVKKETIYDMFCQEYIDFTRSGNGKFKFKGLRLNREEQNAISKSSPVNFLFSPNSLLTPELESLKDDDETKIKRKNSAAWPELLHVVSDNFSFARRILADLSYLGPIREKPHRNYEITNENYLTVGQKGENMPNLFKKHKDKIEKDLNNWVEKFGFGNKVTLDKLYDDIYSIRFWEKDSNKYTNIANSGFGASQILPLIIQALVSPRESLTIAEQPEIHLNPRLQGVLAELFCFMASKDQRIIVETHSEHLLMRLRRLVALKKIKSDDIAIYFVEKINGNSEIKEIAIEENGSIKATEWPKGFFDEALNESLALASAQHKLSKN